MRLAEVKFSRVELWECFVVCCGEPISLNDDATLRLKSNNVFCLQKMFAKMQNELIVVRNIPVIKTEKNPHNLNKLSFQLILVKPTKEKKVENEK